MLTVKAYNQKLGRLRSTRKITNAMKLVAVNKLRKTQARRQVLDTFQDSWNRLAALVAGADVQAVEPLAQVREPVRNGIILLVTSDRGLCGGFNNVLFRHVTHWMQAPQQRGINWKLHCYGRRGYVHFRNRLTVAKYYRAIMAKPIYLEAFHVSDELQQLFRGGQADAVWVAHNRSPRAGAFEPVLEPMLPCRPELPPPAIPYGTDLIVEPSPAAVVHRLVAWSLHHRLFEILLENTLGTQGARMLAMDSATRNVDELIDTYTLQRNRVRQGAITRELMEILGGAEALKG